MGEIAIDKLWTMDEEQWQKSIIHDLMLIYIVGTAASDDPLIDVRTAVYLISGRIRRKHLDEEMQQVVK